MQYLDLENNKLSSLLETIGNLINLKTLNLFNNQLSSLPETIRNLINLQYLNLDYNQLRSLLKSILKFKKFININGHSYKIDNLDIDCAILIFSELQINIGNLPINIKEIWLDYDIQNPNIKLPFGCEIKKYKCCVNQ